MKRIDPSTLDLKDKVVTINRVSKTVKGGRTMRFSALVVVGDGNGHVGCGMGKAAEIPDAIRKGKEAAMKNIIKVEMNDVDSIYHGVTGEYGSASVLLMPDPKVLVSSPAVLPVWFASWLVSRISVPRRWAPPTSRMSFWQPFRD